MDVWSQIDGLKKEHDGTKRAVGEMKGWRFKGRKPNGDWVARHGTGKAATLVREPTSARLLAAVKAAHCSECGHLVVKRVPEIGCRGFVRGPDGKRRCGCKVCAMAMGAADKGAL